MRNSEKHGQLTLRRTGGTIDTTSRREGDTGRSRWDMVKVVRPQPSDAVMDIPVVGLDIVWHMQPAYHKNRAPEGRNIGDRWRRVERHRSGDGAEWVG